MECPICNCDVDSTDKETTVKLRAKGCETINEFSKKKGYSWSVTEGDFIHKKCRRDFTHPRSLNTLQTVSSTDVNNSLNTRSSVSFDFKENCMFCGTNVKVTSKKSLVGTKRKQNDDVYKVAELDFQKTIYRHIQERGDDWAQTVLGRISNIIDLPAADAIYHQVCSSNFRTGKDMPKRFCLENQPSSCKKIKLTPNRYSTDILESFNSVTSYIEDNEGIILTISELSKMMEGLCGERAYSTRHMKSKLIEHFGDCITVISQDGKADRVMMKKTASAIISEFSVEHYGLTEKEKKDKIISTAAKLIKSDINSINISKKLYPSPSIISSIDENKQVVPESLLGFLSTIISGKEELKIISIGQAIIQAAKPRGLLMPLQLGFGVQMHHHFGSRYLIDFLHELGYSCSYTEVQRFERNAAAALNTSIPGFVPGNFVQWVADNVDHNTGTIDGNNTFHGMGIIACTSPATPVQIPVPRADASIDLSEVGRINVKYFKYLDQDQENMIFSKLPEPEMLQPNTSPLDVFSKLVWSLKPKRPSWTGFMQTYSKGRENLGTASICFMPMIDMSPSDPTCINSTLHFICDQSKRYDVKPVITFDQPLFQKAANIIHFSEDSSPLKNIILRLGGFHTEMSFLGSIGYLMSGSGLTSALERVYAPNAVTHMMSGKAYSRAIRGHFLLDSALHAKLMELSFDTNRLASTKQIGETDCLKDAHSTEQNRDDDILLDRFSELYDTLEKKDISSEDVATSVVLKEITDRVENTKRTMKDNRTAQLWFQYMKMISILQDFIRAERIGDWNGHLQALRRMLPYFAASGHFLYLKSAHIYLQQMHRLKTDHPEVHQQFLDGNHSIRRSERHWAGLPTDLVIEQVLMRSLKTTGGLTRGRGLSETQRTTWLLSMPACAELSNSMQELTGCSYESSDQHKDVTKARSSKDEEDTRTLLAFLNDHSPFNITNDLLRNIETGVTANDKVNVDRAEYLGQQIVNDMAGKLIDEPFKRSNKVVTLNDSNSLKISDEVIEIDPQLLFQRLTTVAGRYYENISEIFEFELSTFPSSLFENNGLLREAHKSTLAEAIWKLGDCKATILETTSHNTVYVIDGGSLLQRINWMKDGTFGDICNQYSDYLIQRYADSTTVVVFDGYVDGPSVKDNTHERRSHGRVTTEVFFAPETPFNLKKSEFLKNTANKQKFIFLLGDHLMKVGINVIHSTGDADYLIVSTAIDYAEQKDVFVIGEDTDLLVLLCYHATTVRNMLYFRSDKNSRTRPKVWDIKKTCMLLTTEICKILPYLHALTGCDSTSRINGLGKSTALKAMRSNPELVEIGKQMVTDQLPKDEVIKLGERALVIMIGGADCKMTLNKLRFHIFASKVITSTVCVQVNTLPPTSDAASFHSQRVYIQTQIWIGNNTLEATDWGWKQSNTGTLRPIKTSLTPAPEQLLTVVRCHCKVNCDTKRCTCRKHGLECTPGCGSCRGINCSNSKVIPWNNFEGDLD